MSGEINSGKPSGDKMRANFEKWCIANNKWTTRDERADSSLDDGYLNLNTHCFWIGWQAAYAAQSTTIASLTATATQMSADCGARERQIEAANGELARLTGALGVYANPDNWVLDSNAIARIWHEPGSSTPECYAGFEYAMKALEPAPWAAPAAPTRRQCQGCNGHGLVGNILDTDTCPFCNGEGTEAAPVPAPNEEPKPIDQQMARWTIDGAITKGRIGDAPPPSEDHWLMQYYRIGQQLTKLGETSAWDNVTPADDAREPAQGVLTDEQIEQTATDIAGSMQNSSGRTYREFGSITLAQFARSLLESKKEK